jgi:hypothetical protein
VTIGSVDLADVQTVSPGARIMEEGGVTYIYFPSLTLPDSCKPRSVEGLLRPGPGPDGYTTRLFLSSLFTHRGQNWTTHRILGKAWYTPSYNNVPSDMRLIEILANHLLMLK